MERNSETDTSNNTLIQIYESVNQSKYPNIKNFLWELLPKKDKEVIREKIMTQIQTEAEKDITIDI